MRYAGRPSAAEKEGLERMLRQETGPVAGWAHMIPLSAEDYAVAEIVEIRDTTSIQATNGSIALMHKGLTDCTTCHGPGDRRK